MNVIEQTSVKQREVNSPCIVFIAPLPGDSPAFYAFTVVVTAGRCCYRHEADDAVRGYLDCMAKHGMSKRWINVTIHQQMTFFRANRNSRRPVSRSRSR